MKKLAMILSLLSGVSAFASGNSLDCKASGSVDGIVTIHAVPNLYNLDQIFVTLGFKDGTRFENKTAVDGNIGYGDNFLSERETGIKGRTVRNYLEINQGVYSIISQAVCDIQYDDECVGPAQTPSTIATDKNVTCTEQ